MTSTLSSNNRIRVRPATQGDAIAIYEMVRAAAAEQGGEEGLCANPDNLLEDGFGDNARFHCLLAQQDGNTIGMALYFFIYSTWISRSVLYLEDMYVCPSARRQGVARQLMAHLAEIAIEANCLHARWLVLKNNMAAVNFYMGIGAEQELEWSPMFMESERLKRLARLR